MALTRHRQHTTIFVARETAADLDQLARQMARVDDRRAASQFHYDRALVRRAEQESEFRSRGQSLTAGPKPEDERQRKIDEVLQGMLEQRERDRGRGDRER